MFESALALATQQRNLPRQELDASRQRNDQVFGQTLQAAQVMGSMADRAAARQEQKRQFDIVQAMREEEFDLNKKQAMASLTERNTAMKLRELELAQKTKALDELPMQQAAGMALSQFTANLYKEGVSDPATINKRFGDFLATNPEVSRYLPQPTIQNAILDTQKALVDTRSMELDKAFKVKEAEMQFGVMKDAYDLGVNPRNFEVNGQVQTDLLAQAVALKKESQRQRVRDEALQGRLQIINATADARAESSQPGASPATGAALLTHARDLKERAEAALRRKDQKQYEDLMAQARLAEEMAGFDYGQATTTSPAPTGGSDQDWYNQSLNMFSK